ncbi:MAG: hypothetical protein ACI4NV_02455 [Thermoguttaceae bacterium]
MSASLSESYAAFDKRFQALLNQEESDSARADLAVKRLELCLLAPRFGVAENPEERVKEARAFVDQVVDRNERDYLRRILVNAALRFEPSPALDEIIEEIIPEIFSDEERQNALYARLVSLGKRPGVDCEKLRDRIDELDDLRQYENATAYLHAANEIAGVEYYDDLDTLPAFVARHDSALLELLSGRDPQDTIELLKKQAEKTYATFLRVAVFFAQTAEKKARTIPLNDDLDEVEVDEEIVDALRTDFKSVGLVSPLILEYSEKLRGLFELYDGFEGTLSLLKLLAEAKPGTLFYPKDAASYDQERVETETLAQELAKGDARRLARLAQVALANETTRYAGKNATREALKLLGGERGSDSVDAYATLVRAHLDAGMKKPASKLATLLAKAILSFESEATIECYARRYLDLFDAQAVELFNEVALPETLTSVLNFAADARRAQEDALPELFERALKIGEDAEPLVAGATLLDLVKLTLGVKESE